LGAKIAQLKFGGSKSHNCEIWGVKIAQLKLGGPKLHNCEIEGTKLHLSLLIMLVIDVYHAIQISNLAGSEFKLWNLKFDVCSTE
jgi:hypothetical protein